VTVPAPAGTQPPGSGAHARRFPRALSSLRHRNFRLFWIGQLVSLIGTWMQGVAQGWLVLLLTDDPLALGIVAAAQFGPVIVFGLFGGVLADAIPKRMALVGTQVAAMVLALVLGVLVSTGTVQVWHVYLLAVLLGVVNAFDMPIRQSFVMEMVGRRDIVNAVALNSGVFNGTRIVGPAIAGLLIAGVGLDWCFYINAVSYLAVVVGLLRMRTAELLPIERSGLQRTWRSVADQLVEGLRYVRASGPILLALVVLGVVATVALNTPVLVPVLARDVLGGNSETFGFLMAAGGVGSVLSAVSIAFGQRPTMRLLLIGAAAVGVAMIGLGISRSLPISLGLMVVAGWGTIAMAATTNSLIQLSVPDALRGRVMSVYTTVFAGSVPLGGLFAGGIAAVAGVPAAFAIGGILALVTVAAAAARSAGGGGRLATLRRSPDPDRSRRAARVE
jgi:MFS family permease